MKSKHAEINMLQLTILMTALFLNIFNCQRIRKDSSMGLVEHSLLINIALSIGIKYFFASTSLKQLLSSPTKASSFLFTIGKNFLGSKKEQPYTMVGPFESPNASQQCPRSS